MKPWGAAAGSPRWRRGGGRAGGSALGGVAWHGRGGSSAKPKAVEEEPLDGGRQREARGAGLALHGAGGRRYTAHGGETEQRGWRKGKRAVLKFPKFPGT